MSNPTIYVMHPLSRHYGRQCKRCCGKLRDKRKFVLDLELPCEDNLPVIFHAERYKLYWKDRK